MTKILSTAETININAGSEQSERLEKDMAEIKNVVSLQSRLVNLLFSENIILAFMHKQYHNYKELLKVEYQITMVIRSILEHL